MSGGKCLEGICPWGKCPGGTCPGGLCPRTVENTTSIFGFLPKIMGKYCMFHENLWGLKGKRHSITLV